MQQKRTTPKHKSNIPNLNIIDLDHIQNNDFSEEETFSDQGYQDSQGHQNNQSTQSNQDNQDNQDIVKKQWFITLLSHINWHIVFLLAVVLCIGLVFFRISNWGTRVPSLFDPDADFDESEMIEVLDNMINVPADLRQDTDGVRTVVVLGNSPFADERDAADGVINLVSQMTDAVIYNCSVADSHLAAAEDTFRAEKDPMDAFNLYWLTTLITLQNDWICEAALDVMGDAAPADARYAYDTLSTLDFQNVDVLAIMYDASDYLEERPLYNDQNPTDIQTFAGNMDASLELLRNTYPHIRIIVMSPTYAFYVGEDGEYISSDIHKSTGYSLSTYAGNLERIAYLHTVSYLDNIYGTVNEDNARDYLTDNLHLNAAGRQKLAERFVYALEYYDP